MTRTKADGSPVEPLHGVLIWNSPDGPVEYAIQRDLLDFMPDGAQYDGPVSEELEQLVNDELHRVVRNIVTGRGEPIQLQAQAAAMFGWNVPPIAMEDFRIELLERETHE